jgi:hypothetical protein
MKLTYAPIPNFKVVVQGYEPLHWKEVGMVRFLAGEPIRYTAADGKDYVAAWKPYGPHHDHYLRITLYSSTKVFHDAPTHFDVAQQFYLTLQHEHYWQKTLH